MRRIFLILTVLTALILAGSCCPKVVPTPSTNTTVVVRDSIVYHTDSIKVPVPYEVVRNVVPAVEVWQAETSVAEARCELDTNLMVLRGELKNKKTTLDQQIQVPEHFHSKDSIQKVEIPVPYEVVKYKTPKWCWWILGIAVLLLAMEVLKIFMEKRIF